MILFHHVGQIINQKDSLRILTTVDDKGTHSIVVGSAYCPDDRRIILASVFMQRTFRNLWAAKNGNSEVTFLVVGKDPSRKWSKGFSESFEVRCTVESFQMEGDNVHLMRQRLSRSPFTGVWLLSPKSITCQSPGPWAGKPIRPMVSAKDIPAKPINGHHHMMKSHELLLPSVIGTKRLELDIQRYLPGGYSETRSHQKEEQAWFVLSGHGTARLDGNMVHMKPRSFVFIPRNTPHSVRNTGDEELVIAFVKSALE
jgi:mannose-6-phosphate isomerase-like protein (cupin superfamily)